MRLTGDELKELYQEQTSRSVASHADCPDADWLMRAAADELSPAEHNRLADHLVICSDCAEEYALVLNSGLEETSGRGAILRSDIGLDRSTDASWWARFASAQSTRGYAYSLGGLLLIVSVVLIGWVVSLRLERQLPAVELKQNSAELHENRALKDSLEETQRKLDEANLRSEQFQSEIAELTRKTNELSKARGTQPQLNPFIADLDPRDSVRGAAPGTARTIEVPPRASLITLILNIVGKATNRRHALEIVNRQGKLIWQGEGLESTAENNFIVAFPRSLLPAGEYRVKLYGVGDGRHDLVEDYAVRIVYR